MVYRPTRIIGRFVLAACAVSFGVASLSAQSVPSTTAPFGPNPSKVDVFLGYSYFGTHSVLKPSSVQYSSIDVGAIGSAAYFFSKYVGGEVSLVAHPDGPNDSLYTASAGPIFRLPLDNMTFFGHGLVGGADLLGPNDDSASGFTHNPYQWGVGITAGGGLDYALPYHDGKLSIRLFQADYKYVHDDFGPYQAAPVSGSAPGGGRANISAVELSTGIVLHFGHIIPPPPVTYACSVSPATVFPGDPVTVTGTPSNLDPKKTVTYSWSGDSGVVVSGTSSTGNIDTKSLAPGTYNVKGHVSEGTKPGLFADCTASFTVKAFEPPTIGCSANPSTVAPGDSSTITASGMSPQNRPLTYSYTSTAGSISGTSSTATLTTVGAAPGPITITCNVVDDKGQSASQQTQVTVVAPSAPPAPTTTSLCSISFERDKKRPTRVDNEAKACLDDIALNLQRTSDAKLAIVGNADAAEKKSKKEDKFGAERAVHAKEYLVTEKGIDGSRITVYSGTTDAKTDTTTLIPTGATFDANGATPVDENMFKKVVHKVKHAVKKVTP
jgi:outer membrane protein OmpA-like peptidoglycan-associated protein